MKDIKWISVSTEIFNDEKMCAIESLPDGISIELVWLKLLCLAGTCNESGFLMISKELPYTDEMISKYFRMDIGVVKRALEVFQQMGMIEIIENIYLISNWSKYQNDNELQRIKEANRIRQQRYRDNKKALVQKSENSEEKNRNVTVTSQNNVTCHDFCSICNMSFKDIYELIINYLNTKTNNQYRPTTKKTQTCIRARINEGFVIDDFKKVIDNMAADWMGTDFEMYLRPETLFGTKFESYLNRKPKEKKTGTDWENIH